MNNVVHSGISVFIFLGIWEIFGRSGFVHISLFPPPTHVALALFEMARAGDLMRDIGISLWRAAAGWTLGSLAGVVVGLITGRVRMVKAYLSPIIQLFRPLPPVAMIPLIIVWFGIGEFSKLFSIAFAVFFPVWVNTHVGAERIPNTFVWSAKSLHASGSTILWKVIFPGALSFIYAGLRTGVALAFVMVFVSELAGASAGLGYQISVSHLAYRVDRMMGALIVLALLGAMSDMLLGRFVLRKYRWLQYLDQK